MIPLSFLQFVIISISCVTVRESAVPCIPDHLHYDRNTDLVVASEPFFSGNSVDVVLSAEAAYVWDIETGKALYDKEAGTRRPVASLSKLLSVLTARQFVDVNATVAIPQAALRPQSQGAHVRLPAGEHTTARHLYAASLVPSANDAMVALAVAAKSSEEEFVETANEYAPSLGIHDTKLANATGLPGGDQYSTAKDVARMLDLTYADPVLAPYLFQERGVLTTIEGSRREYVSTNKLLGTYMPIVAAKTGYTLEAGQSLAIITRGAEGQLIGAVVLGSEDRFHDMKVLVEWIWRNYTWPS